MSIQVFQHIKDAIRNLDPEEIRKHTERPLRLLLYADNEQQYRDMEDYLLPRDLSAAKRAQVRRLIYRGSDGAVGRRQATWRSTSTRHTIWTPGNPRYSDSTP